MLAAVEVRNSALTTPAASPRGGRIDSIDVLRGVILILMALDHTRDFFTNLSFEPEDLQQTWPTLFLTRWVTHFCAPLFFFLAGTAAFFYGQQRAPLQLQRFLWTRGLWLIVLEFTVVGFAWTFDFPSGLFGVIWALGCSMILLSAAARLPLRWIATVGIALIVLHNLADSMRPEQFGSYAWIWNLLHESGLVRIAGSHEFVLFPLIPLCGVMAAGYAFGAVCVRDDRRKLMVWMGSAMTIAFVVLRLTNFYGNPPASSGGVTPGDFHLQPTLAKTIILFLDTEKYPASLQFPLMTLGPGLLLLAVLDGKRMTLVERALRVFGRVPLFFYVLHLYVIHLLAIAVAWLMGQPYDWLLHGGFWSNDRPESYGYDLPMVYVYWAIVVALLYFHVADIWR